MVRRSPADAAAHLAFGAQLRAYRFDKYRTRRNPGQGPRSPASPWRAGRRVPRKRLIARSARPPKRCSSPATWCRSPPTRCTPETLAQQAASLTEFGLSVEILDEDRMRELGMGALLGVGQGSVRPSRVVVMQHTAARGSAHRLYRQGRLLRHRRHLDQAGRRHGGHEVGHGRGRRRDRADAAPRHARRQGPTRSASSASPRNMPSGNAQPGRHRALLCRDRPSRS